MRWLVLLIEAGFFFLVLYVLGRYVAVPILKYVSYHKRMAQRHEPKSAEELQDELDRVRLGDEIIGAHLDNSRELEDRLDDIFDQARKPSRKAEME